MEHEEKEKLMARFWRQLVKASDAGRGTYVNADVVYELDTFFSEQTEAVRENHINATRTEGDV